MTALPPTTRLQPSRIGRGRTYDFSLGALSGTLTVTELSDGQPGEIFIRVAKQGSTLAGLCESLSITTSLALQHRTPVIEVVGRLLHTRYEPSGYTGDPDVPTATSLSDYVARRLAIDFLDSAELAQLNISSPTHALASAR